jgi:hypothetical protein
MTVLSGEFVTVYLDDYAGTLTDVSSWVESVSNLRVTADDGDVTSFRSDGANVAGRHIRGAVAANPTLNFYFIPAVMDFLMPLWLKRTGITLTIIAGSNAGPIQGDEVFTGEMVMADVPMAYTPGSVVKIPVAFHLVDGATAVTIGYRG